MRRALTLVALTLPWAAHAGEVSPRLLHPLPGVDRSSGAVVRVVATLEERPTPALLERVRRAGARTVELPMGGIATVGRLVSLDVPRARLREVASVPGIRRLDPAAPRMRRTTLDRTAGQAGARQVWLAAPPAQRPLDGSGVVIADHEFGWDPFHPDFFFPDGGLYDWVDTDGDGAFGRADAVVLDGRPQRLRFIEPHIDNSYDGTRVDSPPGLTPDLDWLYVDTNGNGVRDYGAGFSGAPALGEPLFVADDVDGDGVLGVGEKLVRLGTPKVAAIYDNGRLFDRSNLGDYVVADGAHGVGATGIAVAGWPELRRFTGVAPGASLVLIHSEDPVEGIAVGDRLGAQVHFWEFVSIAELHDGSSALERAISESAGLGTVQVTATGNIGGSGHNMAIAPLPGGQPTRVPLETVPPGGIEPSIVILSLTWVGDPDELEVHISARGGPTVQIAAAASGSVELVGVQRLVIDSLRERSINGTASVMLAFSAPDVGSVAPQGLDLVVRSPRAIPELRGLLIDDVSGWGVGAHWLERLTQRGTAMAPSTADRSIAVGAYGGINDLSAFGFGRPGELRPYSGTGPRLDGVRVVDVVAPDDPFAPALGFAYESFGGTSGALPHVTGVAALLISSGRPNFDAVERALTQGARTDVFTGAVPNPNAGFGKVSASNTIRGEHRDIGARPGLVVTGFEEQREVVIGARATRGGAPIMRIDWDRDYDRVYESSALTTAESTIVMPSGSTDRVVARVVDTAGQSARVMLRLGDIACARGECRGANGLCGPCTPDAGLPDIGARFDAGRDGGKPSDRDAGGPLAGVDASAIGEVDGGAPGVRRPSLQTIPEEELTCGCRTIGAAPSPPWLAAAALAWVGWRRRGPRPAR